MRPTLNRYISKKLDGVQGELPRTIHMFKKSFVQRNFRMFWNIWNPIYSYVLTFFVYKPLRQWIPKSMALLLTFVINGLFHDIVVLILLGETRLTLSKLFFIYGIIVILESYLKINLPSNKFLRLVYNLALLLTPVPFII